MRVRLLAGLAAAVVVAVSGCSSSGGAKHTSPTSDGFTEGAVTPAASKTYQWGQQATVVGQGGGQIKVTPVGVLYHRGPYTSGLDKPENGWFVAVALKAEVVSQQEQFEGGAVGGGFRWRGSSQTIWGGDGNASVTPWVGAVPEFTDPMEPGSPEIGIETFDIPAKGGRLLYINPDESIVSWELPAADTGTGLEKVRSRIKDFS